MGSSTELEGKIEGLCEVVQALGDRLALGGIESLVVRARVVLSSSSARRQVVHRLNFFIPRK